MRILIVAVTLIMITAATRASAQVTGFTMIGRGTLTGRVTELDGTPLRTDVHIVAKDGRERIVSTDRDGRYRCELPAGGHTLVYVFGEARIVGQAAIGVIGPDGHEEIEIREAVPPSAVAQSLTGAAVIPPYTKPAIAADAWVRAWAMLDVDDTAR